MLSRVAERVYWLARYIERVENSARLAKVHSQLMFDMPKSVSLSWYNLVEITSNEAYFEDAYETKTEKNVMAMFLTDMDNPTSVLSSLWWARENIRTTRDILPREAWIQINKLYLMVKENQADFLVRRKRNQLINQIIQACQAWSGMMSGTMSQNETYRFIKLGMSIERADMTSRLLDEAGLYVAQEAQKEGDGHYNGILWANLLKSSSAYFMYRQKVQSEIDGDEIVNFLLTDTEFARSVLFCVDLMHKLVLKLPASDPLLTAIESLKKELSSDTGLLVGTTELHDYLDEVQLKLSAIHRQFYEAWFNPKEVV